MQHMRYTQQNRQRKRQRQRETSDAKVWQASMASMVTSWVFHRNLFSLEVWGRCSPRVRDQTWLTTAAVVVPVSPMLPATAVAVVTACSQMYRQSVRPLHVPVRLLPVCLCVCVWWWWWTGLCLHGHPDAPRLLVSSHPCEASSLPKNLVVWVEKKRQAQHKIGCSGGEALFLIEQLRLGIGRNNGMEGLGFTCVRVRVRVRVCVCVSELVCGEGRWRVALAKGCHSRRAVVVLTPLCPVSLWCGVVWCTSSLLPATRHWLTFRETRRGAVTFPSAQHTHTHTRTHTHTHLHINVCTEMVHTANKQINTS